MCCVLCLLPHILHYNVHTLKSQKDACVHYKGVCVLRTVSPTTHTLLTQTLQIQKAICVHYKGVCVICTGSPSAHTQL